MKNEHFQGLLDRVRGGDSDAAHQLRRVLQPVVSRAVRRILEDEEFGTPLGRRVQDVLAEVGGDVLDDPAADLEPTAVAVARRICRQTVARLRFFHCDPTRAMETILS